MLSGSQRASGGIQIHVQVKDKVKSEVQGMKVTEGRWKMN